MKAFFFGFWAVVFVATAGPAFAYSVKGVSLGDRVHFGSKAYNEYDCNPSEQFDGYTWCTKEEDESERRGSFKAYYSILHSKDGTILYVSRFQEPAFWGKNEVKDDVEYYSHKIGGPPTNIIKMPHREGFPDGTIATWGDVLLERVVDPQAIKVLSTGKSPKIGVMFDFIGNYERSVKNDLPVYRITGGAGFVWGASYNSHGRGTLRLSAINPAAFYPRPVAPPSTAPPPPPLPAPAPSPSPPSATISTGTGFFVSSEGHIVTNAHVVNGCRSISASRSGTVTRVTRFASDEGSDLALLMSSEKPRYWATLQGGRGARVAEAVMVIGFPYGGSLSPDATVTTGIIATLSGIRNDRRIIQITAPVQPGNSGSPVLALNGSVVGVVVGKLNPFEGKGDVPQNVNFAVSLGILQSFLNTYAVPYIIGDSENNKNYADIAAEGIRYTVLIECSR